MATQKLQNAGITTLAEDIDISETVWTTADGSVFPSAGDFRVMADSEIALCTGRSGNDLTVTRGAEGTAAATHSNGATLRYVVTAGALDQMRTDDASTAAYASRQAAEKDGRLFLPNNGVYLERDTGAAWAPWGPIFPFTVPIDGDFAWINQGGAAVVTTQGGIYLSVAGAGSGTNLRCRVKSAPATPYTITAYVIPAIFQKSFHSCGLIFRQSSDGKIHVFDFLGDTTANAISLRSSKFTNATTFSAQYQATPIPTPFNWLRIADNGTNRICSYSADGQNWHVYHTIGRTDFLTADQVGFYVGSENSAVPNLDVGMSLLSWKQA